MNRPVTMKTVAQKAGVTQATVSLSLANHPRIPPATRARIQDVARALGYRPNPFVSALMRARRQSMLEVGRPVLALVNCLEARNTWRSTPAPTVRAMLSGAIARTEARGYQPQEFWLHEDGMSAARFGSILRARGIVGALLSPLAAGEPPPDLPWAELATVRLGVPLPDLNLPSVCNDHFAASQQIAREAHALGYRRPGLVLSALHRTRFHGRWDGGLEAARFLLPGLRAVQPLVLESFDDTSPLGSWLAQEQPDLVITPQPESLEKPLAKLGFKVPRRIGLASLACRRPDDPISGVWQNGALLGATAVDRVISMLEANERGLTSQPSCTMVGGVWNPGTTLPPRR